MKIDNKQVSITFLKNVAAQLKASGVTGEIVLEFNGSGDDGCSDLSYNGIDLDSIDVSESDVESHMTNLVTIDWCNNEGGQGSVTLDIATGKISVHEEENYTEVNSSDKEY